MLIGITFLKTILTWEQLEADRKAYVNDMSGLGFVSVIGIVAAVIGVALLVLMIRFAVQAKKCKREGEEGSKAIINVIRAVIAGFVMFFFLGLAGVTMVPSLLIRIAFSGQPTNVVSGTLSHKNELEQHMSSRGRHGTHHLTGKTYVLVTTDGEEYNVSKEVYDEAEEGNTYYFGVIGTWENCFAIYDTEEYDYV